MDRDASAYQRPAEPSPAVRDAALALLGTLTGAGNARSAVERVEDDDQIVDVAVAPGGRWRARTSLLEWAQTADGMWSWYISLAGARERVVTEPPGWIHPAVGLLRPDLLPVWGRPGDRFQPVGLVDGVHGPALVDLAPVACHLLAGSPVDHGAALHVDASRWLVTRVELDGRTWTLLDYTATR